MDIATISILLSEPPPEISRPAFVVPTAAHLIVMPNVMNTETLLREVEKVFIPVNKPSGFALSFHKVGCDLCEYLRKDLENYRDQLLPPEAIRYIHGEISCLSAKGWRWVLPSYLHHCLTADSTTDHEQATEFLIYNLGPDLKYQKEAIQRLSLLNPEQINCLIHFLEWCAQHAYWSTYCPEDINKGLAFMQTLRHNKSLQTDRQKRRLAERQALALRSD